jgi:prolipoprotein diacylglyceryltransferase
LESLFCLILFLQLLPWAWNRSSPQPPGRLALTVILSYGAARFLLEFIRGDAARGGMLGLSTSQWIALVVIGLAATIWYRLLNRSPSV